MEVKRDIIYSNDKLDVVHLNYGERESVAICYKVEKVVILPYTRTSDDVINELGIVKEFNPTKPNNYHDTLITETEEDEDDNYLDTAIRGLHEEAGYRVIDETRWLYLGMLFTSKVTDLQLACYAVDITGIERISPKPDDKVESLTMFRLAPISEIIKTDDSLCLSLLMKLYVKKYGKTFVIQQDTNI